MSRIFERLLETLPAFQDIASLHQYLSLQFQRKDFCNFLGDLVHKLASPGKVHHLEDLLHLLDL